MMRRYERWGILPPAWRNASGHRVFGKRHLHAVKAGRAMQAGYGRRTGNQILRKAQEGALAQALEVVDRCLAALHERRVQVEQTLEALRLGTAAPDDPPPSRRRQRSEPALRGGEAAQAVGMQVSSLHFWDAQGMLDPAETRSAATACTTARRWRGCEW